MDKDTLKIQDANDGSVITVKAHPGARKDSLDKVHNGVLKISITQVPEKGKANNSIISLLSKSLNIPKRDIEIIKGSASRQKTIFIRGIKPDKLKKLIGKILNV